MGFVAIVIYPTTQELMTIDPSKYVHQMVHPATLGWSDNDLTELPPGVFDGLDNLQELQLHHNPGPPFQIIHPNDSLPWAGWER